MWKEVKCWKKLSVGRIYVWEEVKCGKKLSVGRS